MYMYGVLLALVCLIAWGIGDFLIQKSTRKIGVWETSVYISFLGTLILTPFALTRAPVLSHSLVGLFFLAGVVTAGAVWINFTALKKGKLSVIQPIMGLEVPLVVLIGYFFLAEQLSMVQYAAIALITISLIMVAYTKRTEKFTVENGVLWGVVGAVGIALMDVFKGGLSQLTHPLFALWAINAVWFVISLFILASQGALNNLFSGFKRHPKIVVWQSVLDNIAWIAFGFAVLYAPISIVLAISENFILLSVLLGVFVNKERLVWWQVIGIVLAMIGILLLV